jgi:CHASE3 domain sensor protein
MGPRAGSFGERPVFMSPILSNWPSQRRLAFWHALTLGLLLLNGLVTYSNVRTISKGADQITRTHDVIKSLDDVLLDLRTAESGQRGFLLTGEEAYLAPYSRATATVDAAMERLKALTADDPVSRSRADVDELERLARAKLAELAETIELRREQSGEAALAVVKGRRGRSLMSEIVERITRMEGEEVGARRR